MHRRLKAHIAHRTPGRLRLKIHAARDNAGFFAALKAELVGIEGVLSVTVNPAAASIVIVHDGSVGTLALCNGIPALAIVPSAIDPIAAEGDGAADSLRAEAALLLIKLLPFACARHPLAQLAEIVAEPVLRVVVQALTRPSLKRLGRSLEDEAVLLAA
ncbi:hypothetical protein SAZ10_31900 [Mesorhizobium sp. BAC0120]|uniref:hypothetical protein n=1 Tax=Mesorhizobium sp. BAC0120 TaxID=3090670 RepID=UPI00298CB6F4|nr:hypothetical protein [Mesorhizobium sp. BAC0120]MDW6026374.1 hypothetical protein [Mesorhizobium sp. BAC0120]